MIAFVFGAIRAATGYAVVNAVLGLGYVLGELPNSFAKRRVKIQPGKTIGGVLGALFFVLDQADSVIAAIGLNIHFGFTGLLNIGQAGFMLIGAYGFAITVRFTQNFWLGVAVSLLAACRRAPGPC